MSTPIGACIFVGFITIIVLDFYRVLRDFHKVLRNIEDLLRRIADGIKKEEGAE